MTPRIPASKVLFIISVAVSVSSEKLDIPLSNLKKAEDLSSQLPYSETPEAPDGFSWTGYKGNINISTSILFPYEGQLVENMFDVMLEIAAHPLGAFKERYKDAFQCIEVDHRTPACWPLFDESPIPRLHLPKGEHVLRSSITDPSGEWVLPSTWGPYRNIIISESGLVPSKEESEPEADKDMDGNEGDEAPVQMEVPVIKVVSPPEMSVITSRMVEMQFEVAVRAQQEFETHFQQSYVCGRLLNENEISYCWTLYKTSYMPRWVGLDNGFYTLQASVTHPNSNEIIEGSWGDMRAFLLLADSNEDDLRIGGQDSDMDEKPPNHVVVNIDLNNANGDIIKHQLPVQRGSDLKLVGKRFCMSRGVGNAECVDHIVSEAKSRFLLLDKLTNDWESKMKAKREQQATEAEEQAKQDADMLRRSFKVPEGDGLLVVPDLQDSVLEDYLFTAVNTCETEYKEGGVGLECLTIQSELFGMRARLSESMQESLLDFIGNLGTGFGF